MKKQTERLMIEKISIFDLILLAMDRLEKRGQMISFEGLLKECFFLLPQKLAFSQNRWPDSRKLDRPLRSLRQKRLIGCDKKDLFILTGKAKKKILELNRQLRQKKLKLR